MRSYQNTYKVQINGQTYFYGGSDIYLSQKPAEQFDQHLFKQSNLIAINATDGTPFNVSDVDERKVWGEEKYYGSSEYNVTLLIEPDLNFLVRKVNGSYVFSDPSMAYNNGNNSGNYSCDPSVENCYNTNITSCYYGTCMSFTCFEGSCTNTTCGNDTCTYSTCDLNGTGCVNGTYAINGSCDPAVQNCS